MTDDGGVLGNLPNSRPGKRSAKRDAASAKPPRKRTTAMKGGASEDRFDFDPAMRGEGRIDPVPPPASEDPVGAVVRTATGITVAGVKVAGAVGRELFRRLPRP